jgi:hypothetical protein
MGDFTYDNFATVATTWGDISHLGDEPTDDVIYIRRNRYVPIDIGLSFSVNGNSENAS